MTNKEQEAYWRKYAKQNAKMERVAFYIMLRAISDGLKPIIASLERVGAAETLATIDGLFERRIIEKAYERIYITVGTKHKVWTDQDVRQRIVNKKSLLLKEDEDDKFRRRPIPVNVSGTPLDSQFGIGFFNAEWLQRLKRIVTNIDVAQRVTGVTETIRKEIKRSLSQAQQEFVSIRKITARLRRDLGIFSRKRAEVIARTEVTYVANVAAEQSAEELAKSVGIDLKKIWIHTRDSRTRDSHRSVSTKPINSNEKFMVGGVGMMRPGDPAGGASQTINCRCSVAYLPADDTEGFD